MGKSSLWLCHRSPPVLQHPSLCCLQTLHNVSDNKILLLRGPELALGSQAQLLGIGVGGPVLLLVSPTF